MTVDSRTPTSPAPVSTGVKTPKKLSEAEFWTLVEQLEVKYGLKKPDLKTDNTKETHAPCPDLIRS